MGKRRGFGENAFFLGGEGSTETHARENVSLVWENTLSSVGENDP